MSGNESTARQLNQSYQDADLASARRVLELETQGLQALADSLGEEFVRALDLLQHVEGRIIVTGMGKSGHIGRKIAASLASTGSSAFFVHPGEASHGDLGMITTKDAVIAISNSGETSELSDLIAYTRRFAITLIGITSRAGSTLATGADVALVLPGVSEACPLGLAPTTSTTMTLGLGDAITVALLERRGFSATDFKVFHPGGKLGQTLLKVADLMHSGDQLPLCDEATSMTDAILIMTAKSFGCVGVVDDSGVLAGIVTDGDLRRHLAPDLLSVSVGVVMTKGGKVTHPNVLAAEALRVMNETKITSLFVVDDDDKPVGILHVHDCLRAGVA